MTLVQIGIEIIEADFPLVAEAVGQGGVAGAGKPAEIELFLEKTSPSEVMVPVGTLKMFCWARRRPDWEAARI